MPNTLPPEIEDFLKKLKKLFGSNPMYGVIYSGLMIVSLVIPSIYFYVNNPLINDFKTRKETEEKNNKLIDVNS